MLFGGLLSGLWLVVIGWFVSNAAQQSYQQLVVRRALSGVAVQRVMTQDFPHISPEMPLDEFVHDHLLKQGYQAYPVTDGDNLVGIVGVGEVGNIPREQWHDTQVRAVAKQPGDERKIGENDDAFDALMHMAEGRVRRLLVMNNGQLKGMVTHDSIVELLRKKLQLGV